VRTADRRDAGRRNARSELAEVGFLSNVEDTAGLAM
jgi:hypothetical protein